MHRRPSACISFGTISRGSGKIYVLLQTGNLDDCVLESKSYILGGQEVPSRILVLDSGEKVLVLAVLSVTQTATVRAYDAQGSIVCEVTRNVGRRSAKMASQINTAIRNPLVDLIRNCDTPTRPNDVEFVSTRMVMGAPDEPEYLHVTLCYPLAKGEPEDASLELAAYGHDGRLFGDDATCVLGDSVRAHRRLRSVPCRYVSYSIRVPRWEQSIILWARALSDASHEGIMSIEPFVSHALREDWIRTVSSNEVSKGYEDWFYAHRASAVDLALQERESFDQNPLFSLVVPLYYTPLNFLEDMARSALSQSYANLELILVNSTPDDKELCDAVKRLEDGDSRVRVITIEGNRGITENTNVGIDAAQGDFVCFFDHDDLMEPDLLYWYAKEIEQDPTTDLLYCDEDKFENGHYEWPFFKPDWSPLFLETNNYVCHLLTVRKTLLDQLPRATSEFDGAQDHRLALLAGAKARHVAHVGRILYHWRVHERSTAVNADAKPESIEAGRRAVRLSFAQRQVQADVEPIEDMPHCYRATYETKPANDTTIVVLNEGGERDLRRCLDAIAGTTPLGTRVIATDAIADGRDLSEALNGGLRQVSTEYAIVVSSRVTPTQDQWSQKLTSMFSRPEIGVVGGRIDYADGTKARGAIVLSMGDWNYTHRFFSKKMAGSRGLEVLVHEAMAVSGGCLAIARDVLDKVGYVSEGANEQSWFIDLCLKVRSLGLSSIEYPGGMLTTDLSVAELGIDDAKEREVRFVGLSWLRKRWSGVFGRPDPYYSIHLGGNAYYDLVNDDRSPVERQGDNRWDNRVDTGYLVQVDCLICDVGFDIVRGSVTIKSPRKTLVDGPLALEALDGNGSLLTQEWVCMGDKTSELGAPECNVRRVDYSLRIPVDVESFCVRASLGGGVVALEDVATVGKERVRDMREGWKRATLQPDQNPHYDEWFRLNHRAAPSELDLQRRASEKFESRPTFSIVVPLYKTPLEFFVDMVESVLAQSYPYFELVLVNASPEDYKLARAVQGFALRDKRIREVRLRENLGITQNTNAGIAHAAGDFLAFLDHDDVIEPDLLFWYAKGIDDYPTTDLLYCDEDHLIDGMYALPFFKTDWDIDRLRAENYVCHMLCVRKSVVDEWPELPGSEMDGSQDHNMTLMVGERARNVYHVRRVLYHWRAHDNSTAGAQGTQQKSYALEAERLAVQDHLDRCGEQATAVMGARRDTRIDVQPYFDKEPLVSIVIPNKDMAPVLKRCVDSILTTSTWRNFEIVIVENNSAEAETSSLYDDLVGNDERVRVETCAPQGGFNFSELVNFGFSRARGDYLLMLNNDTEVLTPDWIEQMVGVCRREDVGCVGARLLYPDDTLQHMGVFVGRHSGPTHVNTGLPANDAGYYEVNALPHRMCAVTGACLLTKRWVWEKVGGLDETLPVDYNDIDYCLKVGMQGLACVITPYAELRHYESVTRVAIPIACTTADFQKSAGEFGLRWHGQLLGDDPFFSPSFVYDSTFYKLDTYD